MSNGLRNHLIWGALGVVAVLGLWYAYSVPGALALFGAIGGAFLLWRFIGGTGAWLTVVIVGVTMCSLLSWQAVTSARCPEAGTQILVKDGKAPIGCNELRASAASMAVFFGFIGLIGLAAPLYVAGVGRGEDELEDMDGATPISAA